MWRGGCLKAKDSIKKFIQSAGIPFGRHIRSDVSKRGPRPEDAMPEMRSRLRCSLAIKQSFPNAVLDYCHATFDHCGRVLYSPVLERV
jgi:hypothetical protein